MEISTSSGFLTFICVFILVVVTLSIAEDAVDEEESLLGIKILDKNDEGILDVDDNFFDMFPSPPPPKETDIQYILNLVEKRKWQTKTYQALEKLTCCLYSYHDVVFQVLQASQCYASLPSDIPGWQTSWMNGDVVTELENATSKFPYPCSLRTSPENSTSAGVNVVNASECMRVLEQEPETDEYGSSKLHCAVVLFFSRQCPFSIKMAPNFNALGRAFPGLDIMAVDVSQSSGLYTRYGIVAVPDILLFHRRKPVLRFNYTERSFENLVFFLQNNTGLEAIQEVQVSAADIEGPLPTTLVTQPDYLLLFSNIFVIFFVIYVLKQRLGDSILQRIREYMDYARQVWRTGEIYEQVGVHDNEDGGFG